MGYRIENVHVVMTCYLEFEGARTIEFDYVPAPGDALAEALVAKNDEVRLAEAQARQPDGTQIMRG